MLQHNSLLNLTPCGHMRYPREGAATGHKGQIS